MNQSSLLPSIFLSVSTHSTTLAWTWVVETLAEIKEVDTRILQVPIRIVPNFMSHSSEAAREKIALKYLEEWLDPQWSGPGLPDAPELLDVNKSSEEVLSLLLEKATVSGNLATDGVELFKHELQLFILKKRAALPENSLNMLESAKHISAPVAADNSKIILQEVPSESRAQLAPAAENVVAIMQEDPDEFGPLSGQRDGEQLNALKQLSPPSVPPATDSIKGVLQEDPSRSGRLSSQRNGEEWKLQRKDFVAPAADGCEEIMQEDPSVLGEHLGQQDEEKFQLPKHVSSARPADIGNENLQTHSLRSELQLAEQNDSFELLLQNISAPHVIDSGKVNQRENPKGSEPLLPQHKESQLLEQISVAKVTDRNGSLREYTCGSEEQPFQENALHDGSRELSKKQCVRIDNDNSLAIEPELVSVQHSNRNEVVQASSGSRIEHLPVCRSMTTDAEPSLSKASSDKDGYRGPSSIIDKKDAMFSDEKLGGSCIPSKTNDSTKNGFCLKCDRGGSLLICSTSDCDVAFHQQCIDTVIDFDEKGKFYCPLCAYSQAALAYYKAKKKFSQAKRAVASLFGKDSVRHHQCALQSGVREKGQVRRDGNMNCHEQTGPQKEISKRIEEEMGASIHSDIGRISSVAEAFGCANRIHVFRKEGKIDRDKPFEGFKGKQTCADMLLDNGEIPCSDVRVNVEIPPLNILPLRIVKNESDSGKTAALMTLQQLINNKELSESSKSMKHIAEANGVRHSADLICEQGDKTVNVSLANGKSLKCEAVLPRSCLGMQPKSQEQVNNVTEQNIDNLQYGQSTSYTISERSPKRRKTDLHMSNKMDGGCQGPELVNQQLMEANAINGAGKLTCEKGETSRVRETHALSTSNMRSETSLHGDLSDIQKHPHQDIHVIEHDVQYIPGEAVGAPSTGVYEKRRVLSSAAQNRQLSCKRRNYWSPEEEEALKDAMVNVALENGNVPWAKIWGKIRHILGEGRHPCDLRLKWRNIMNKEARAREKDVYKRFQEW